MVIVIGAGPAGIATSACLNDLSIPNIVLEREDCSASSWKKKTYDRLQLHVPKQVCQLPLMPFPKDYPKYVPRKLFIKYLDDYVSHFIVNPLYNRTVESAAYDEVTKQWCVKVNNTATGVYEEYSDRFLVVAPGPLNEPYTPMVRGLDGFPGHVMHSTEYKNGQPFANKNVLVIGSGNSGMEIACDLSNFGAKPSIVIRSPVHVLSKRIVYMALLMGRIFPESWVDWLAVKMARLEYGDLSKYGIQKPKEGPIYMLNTSSKFPIIDMGAVSKIKSGEIQTLPSITNMKGDLVEFANGKSYQFDAIIFATGFKRSTKTWLKNDDHLDEEARPKLKFPNHWKGKNGFYCAGLGKKGLFGIQFDALNIAKDIKKLL